MSDNKKVLIVTYYWPPSGGSGVQRWLKFVKYLPAFGWKPFVVTPENPSFPVRDESLLKNVPAEAEVIRLPIWEPYEVFQKLSAIFGSSKSGKSTTIKSGQSSLFEKLSIWIRGNFFIPDPRKFWVRPAVRFLEKFIEQHDIRTIITTGPPHSIHLIGLRLKKQNPSLRWLADFRDPWSEWGLLDSLRVSGWARKKHAALESMVLAAADEVITITPFYVRRFSAMGNRTVRLLTNGFDEDDFRNLTHTKSAKFLIRHVGIVNERCDPRSFFDAVAQLAKENSDFRRNVAIEFIGEVHARIITFVKQSDFLREITHFKGNIPHRELIGVYGSSSLLLLVLAGYKNPEGYMPGKLFEYLATGLPILGVGPTTGDAAGLLADSGGGIMVDGGDVEGIKRNLEHHFNQWRSMDSVVLNKNKSAPYSRRAVTGQLSTLLSG